MTEPTKTKGAGSANAKLSEAMRRFFEAEIANEREGISPATLDTARETLAQMPEDVLHRFGAGHERIGLDLDTLIGLHATDTPLAHLLRSPRIQNASANAKPLPGPREALTETLDALQDALTELRQAKPKKAGAYGTSYGPVLTLGAEALGAMPKSDPLMMAAPALAEALKRLLECPALGMDDLEDEDREASVQAVAALKAAGVGE